MAGMLLAVASSIAVLSIATRALSRWPDTRARRAVRGSCAPAGLALAASALAFSAAGPAQAADSCPNAAIRAAQDSAHLPDCRAYEKVTPADKNGANPYFHEGSVQASPDGERIAFVVPASFGDGGSAPRVSNYVGSRSGAGWTAENIMQPSVVDPLGGFVQIRTGYQWFSPDLSTGIYLRNDGPGVNRNLHRRDLVARTNTRVTPDSIMPLDPFSQLFADLPIPDGSTDGRRFLFESWSQLTADAPAPSGVPHLYESVDGEVRFAGVLPDGSAAPASVAGRGTSVGFVFAEQIGTRTMSDDGSRVFFTRPELPLDSLSLQGHPGEVYLREGGETTHISRSRRTDCAGDPTCGGDGEPDPVADPDGPGKVRFETATSDGSFVFLSSCRKLTDDVGDATCTVPGDVEALYRYDVESDELEAIASGTASRKFARVVGVSDDGETVYYAFGPTFYDTYVWHSGQSEFIAGDIHDGKSFSSNYSRTLQDARGSRITPDGRYLVFTAAESFGGANLADNVALYLYDRDAPTDKIVCISCPSDGSPAEANASLTGFIAGSLGLRQYVPRSIDSAQRSVYFNTADALVADDTNGQSDVYRYDIASGEHRLISAGSKAGAAYVGDMSADGSTVFVVTDQQLSGWDKDTQRDVYAVRVDGGFHEPPPAGGSCRGDDCQGEATSLAARRPASGALPAGERLERPVLRLGRLGRLQLARLAAGRRVGLPVRVDRPGELRVVGRARIGRRVLVVARGTAVARRAGTVNVAVRLSRAARRQFVQAGRLRLSLSIRIAGGQTSRTLILTEGRAK